LSTDRSRGEIEKELDKDEREREKERDRDRERERERGWVLWWKVIPLSAPPQQQPWDGKIFLVPFRHNAAAIWRIIEARNHILIFKMTAGNETKIFAWPLVGMWGSDWILVVNVAFAPLLAMIRDRGNAVKSAITLMQLFQGWFHNLLDTILPGPDPFRMDLIKRFNLL
jgi:hypothetical protein